ncbi:MAG TPA: NADH-quinone oxidoreductase subunit I [Thermoanaerobaculia bacterium]|jgi:NADH-quinone oxidoreductase chain I|nr:NADH-quinone oxidoreductase subunit I [Thermoanaerobaculia bacterium]MDI9631765.1 NADH-quinone oxidoreductase subunit I [Acidobacteriota bacterium]OQC42455.1 MAG: NAD(P)H-quinone oxidoreductase subunit I [Acidobacteria bacterium ADurb.Bin051]MBP7813200.1 NADH-quinone oxidoreductase subunit I [Thermoanaerobaculia bacterium]MBP8845276.1 NADH-quinone oxidoreductase subunit I [Thermoanaerobaculia bacterium]
MSALKQFLDRLLLLDLFAGLAVTGRHLFRRKVTVQYPEDRLEPADRFRGMLRLDSERCIKCTLCARDCPLDIIYIDWHQETNPETGKKEKVLDRFDIDIQRCMFCGLCEEACPTEPKSIWLTTKTYELASYDRWQNLYVTMEQLESWRVRPSYTDEEVA